MSEAPAHNPPLQQEVKTYRLATCARGPRFAPGINTSAGRKGNGSGHGNRYLARVLGEAAVAASRTDTFLGARYRRIARRRSKKKKAIVAVGRSTLIVIWHLLHDPDTKFHDLGANHYDQHHATTASRHNHIRALEALGYKVTLEPAALTILGLDSSGRSCAGCRAGWRGGGKQRLRCWSHG